MLFSLYIALIADVIKSCNCLHLQYADDIQLYIGLSQASSQTALDDCFAAVHRWFFLNRLVLNPDKSEAIVVGTAARHSHEGEISSARLGDVNLLVSGCARSLGVTIDRTMSFEQHVNSNCKTSFCHIRALRRIRRLITTADAKSTATAVVSSRLDYCNALLFGTSGANIRKLHGVQNSLARLEHPFSSAPTIAHLTGYR